MIKALVFSFLISGIVCLIGQIIIDNSKLTPGHVTSIFVVLGSILEFFSLYDYLRKLGKMGASIVISSFGSTIMKGVKEMVDKEGFIGIFQGIFLNCSTLISFAIFLSFLGAIFFRSKS